MVYICNPYKDDLLYHLLSLPMSLPPPHQGKPRWVETQASWEELVTLPLQAEEVKLVQQRLFFKHKESRQGIGKY